MQNAHCDEFYEEKACELKRSKIGDLTSQGVRGVCIEVGKMSVSLLEGQALQGPRLANARSPWQEGTAQAGRVK